MVKVVEPSCEIYEGENGDDPFDCFKTLRRIERCGRISWQSVPRKPKTFEEGKAKVLELYNKCGRDYLKEYSNRTEAQIIRDFGSLTFLTTVLNANHMSVIEHSMLTVIFIVDRGFSHELVRHRLCSFTQESTRYNLYSSDKFGNQIRVIHPFWLKEGSEEYKEWLDCMIMIEKIYLTMTAKGRTAQQARCVLPTCLRTEIAVTTNLREWRDVIFKLRTAEPAHPQMRQVMIPLLKLLRSRIPLIFDDITVSEKAEKLE